MDNINKKVLLLIDGDNANKFSEGTFASLFAAAKKYGHIAEAHIFVNGQSVKGDKKNDMLLEMVTKFALHLHVLPIKKNSTDISLSIRAAEKLFTDESFDVYIIVVAGDHDYMPLAIEIRQHGKKAVCFYTKDKDATLLSAFSCHERIAATDAPAAKAGIAVAATAIEKDNINAIAKAVERKIEEIFATEKHKKIPLKTLGARLLRAEINYKQCGVGLGDLLRKKEFSHLFGKYNLEGQGVYAYITKK